MHFSSAIFELLIIHWDTCASILALLVSIVKVTRWGQSKAAALNLVIQAIEDSGDKSIKKVISDKSQASAPAVKDSIDTSVSVADPNKQPLDLLVRVLREVLRVK